MICDFLNTSRVSASLVRPTSSLCGRAELLHGVRRADQDYDQGMVRGRQSCSRRKLEAAQFLAAVIFNLNTSRVITSWVCHTSTLFSRAELYHGVRRADQNYDQDMVRGRQSC